MLIDRRYVRSFDWISFILSFFLVCIGLFFIYSSTYRPEQPLSPFFKKQLFGAGSGLVIYFLAALTDYRTLMRWGYFAYYGVIILLIITLVKGHIGMGAQRWVNVVFFKLQPSELAKLLFPVYATYFFYVQKDMLDFRFKNFVPVLCMLGLSFVLILKQPDLGTALVLLFCGLILLWLSGINKKFFIYSLLFTLVSAPLSWKMLKSYQKKRIAVFFGYGSTKKEGYHIEQSKIAIGSGGLTGKGYLQGTQNRLHFLPESRTDFIFSVVAEELGFIGTCLIVLLYLLLFLRLFAIIITIKSPFIQLLAIGIIIHIVLSTLINIGMVVGILPIVGIPLPLISYGLSNLWITCASLGWFNGIAMRRFYLREGTLT